MTWRLVLGLCITSIGLACFQTSQAAINTRGPEIIQSAPSPTPQSQEGKTENTPAVSVGQNSGMSSGFASSTDDKLIVVTLKTQSLQYFEGTKLIGGFLISSGLPGTPSPPGDYSVLEKKPVVDYKGPNYDFPNTKWNLLIIRHSPLNYYIHGAYWHHNFGHPMSHGCINVSYANMQGLYNWADVGTKVIIQQG